MSVMCHLQGSIRNVIIKMRKMDKEFRPKSSLTCGLESQEPPVVYGRLFNIKKTYLENKT